jgi:hypothetical protein
VVISPRSQRGERRFDPGTVYVRRGKRPGAQPGPRRLHAVVAHLVEHLASTQDDGVRVPATALVPGYGVGVRDRALNAEPVGSTPAPGATPSWPNRQRRPAQTRDLRVRIPRSAPRRRSSVRSERVLGTDEVRGFDSRRRLHAVVAQRKSVALPWRRPRVRIPPAARKCAPAHKPNLPPRSGGDSGGRGTRTQRRPRTPPPGVPAPRDPHALPAGRRRARSGARHTTGRLPAPARRTSRPVHRHQVAVHLRARLVPARRPRPRRPAVRLLRWPRHHHRPRCAPLPRREEHLDQHGGRLWRLQPAQGRPDAGREARMPLRITPAAPSWHTLAVR